MKLPRILSLLVTLMGIVHIAATFSPLIGGKLSGLDAGTYRAMIYMSLMCGLLLVTLGAFLWYSLGKLAECALLRLPIQVAAVLLLINGVAAVSFMPHNPFAWTVGVLCTAEFVLLQKRVKPGRRPH